MSVGLDRGLVHPASVELTRYPWLLFVGFEPTKPLFGKSILALHQLLKEQVDFTQGNNRAKVRVVANHPPEYLRRKLSFLYIPFFSRYYQSVETLSIASIGEILRSIPQSALAFHSQC